LQITLTINSQVDQVRLDPMRSDAGSYSSVKVPLDTFSIPLHKRFQSNFFSTHRRPVWWWCMAVLSWWSNLSG